MWAALVNTRSPRRTGSAPPPFPNTTRPVAFSEVVSTTRPLVDVWYHVAATWHYSSTPLTLYVNGVAEANPDKNVFLFGSDGSQQEGDDAEAARYAVARGLNVKLLLDDNNVTIAGHPDVTITGGSITFEDQDLLAMDPDERARAGVFLAFQYPVEIPGVNSTYFLKAAYNEIRKHHGQPELDAMEFLTLVKEKMKLLELKEDLLKRAVNVGFSGGEKKRNEIFQMAVLEPKLAVLDETDSGLDIDALKIVSQGVNKLKSPTNATLLITHYQRLLDYIVPDFVHVLWDGRIVKSGGKELALELEEKGYDWLIKHDAAKA